MRRILMGTIMLAVATLAVLTAVNCVSYGHYAGIDPLPVMRLAIHNWRSLRQEYLLFLAVMWASWALLLIVCLHIVRHGAAELKNANRHSRGTAEFATRKELKDTGFLTKDDGAVIVGQTADARIRVDGKGMHMTRQGRLIAYTLGNMNCHFLVQGASRSGKGAGIIIPTLLSVRESVFVVDPKGENFKATAGWRSGFSRIFRIDPTDAESDRLNPLDFVPRDGRCVSVTRKLAQIIIPLNEKENTQYWDNTARMLLEVLTIDVLRRERHPSLASVYDMLAFPLGLKKSIKAILSRYETDDDKTSEDDKAVVRYMRNDLTALLAENEETLASTVSTCRSNLALFADPVVRKVTSSSDLDIDGIMDDERPTSVYLTVPPDRIADNAPFIRLLTTLLLSTLQARKTEGKHHLLMVLDEFPLYGRMREVSESLHLGSGFHIHFMIAVQDVNQLYDTYGKYGGDKMLSAFRVQACLSVGSSMASAKYFSDMTGEQTLVQRKTSFSGDLEKGTENHYSTTTSEVGRPLMTPDEIRTMSPEKMLVFISGLHPYLGKKAIGWQTQRFKERMDLPIPSHERVRTEESDNDTPKDATPEENPPEQPVSEDGKEPEGEETEQAGTNKEDNLLWR